jgi:integrase
MVGAMGREYKLTWKPKEQRWRKVYKGHLLSFSGDGGKQASYARALREFQEAKRVIDEATRKNEAVATKRLGAIELIEQEQANLLARHHDTTETREHWEDLERAKARLLQRPGYLENDHLEQEAQGQIEALQGMHLQLPKVWVNSDGTKLEIPPLKQPDGEPPWTKPATDLQTLLQAYLKDRRRQVELGELSMARLNNQRLHLTELGKFLGLDSGLDKLDNPGLTAFRDNVRQMVQDGRLGNTYARDRLQAVQQIINWAFDREMIENLPRCLARGYSIRTTISEPETMPRDQIATMFSRGTARQRLYLLLGLNCGFTNGDISNLAKSEVDLKEGTITRKRSKTKSFGTVPVVVYNLWPETLALLSQEMATTGDLALLTEKGNQLIQQTWNTDGTLRKNDTIHSSWVRLQKSSGVKKPHKLLRKTGASVLNTSEQFSRFVRVYLGHAPSGMAEKHYAQADRSGFQKALAWLRTQFEFA